MEKGTVKFFNQAKGFCFIKVEGSGKEVFVHVSGIKEEIRENDEVVFEIQEHLVKFRSTYLHIFFP